MEDYLQSAVAGALKTLGAGDASFVVEWPTEATHGDYATNAALSASKALSKSPREIAESLVPLLREALDERVEKIEIAGAGFINFTLSAGAVKEITGRAVSEGGEWGRNKSEDGRRVIVEYTDPNPFKEMHIGHLMSNIIGEAIAGLIETDGARVIRASYQGDVGPHVAKALWGLKQEGITEPATAKEIGDAYAHGARAYEESEKAKAEIDALNTAVYVGDDKELMELWRKGRDVSLDAFEELYKILGTHFDYYFFESETATPGKEMVLDGVAKGVFKESEGAVIYDGEKKGLHTLVFITSKGNPTYEAKEVGLAFLKEERCAPYDESIIVTAAEQVGHFKVFLGALEDLAPELAKKTHHVPHGFLRLTSGKMSSREGNVITGEGLIREVMAKSQEKNDDPEIARQVAIGAIKYMILRGAPGGDIVFDPEKSLSLEGDSGPYLQYALVRAKKILSYESDGAGDAEEPAAPYAIERLIMHFPEVCTEASRERAPQKITQYLTRLASAWNGFYASEQVLGSPEEAYKQRVAKAFATTMENGLKILAIPVPERM